MARGRAGRAGQRPAAHPAGRLVLGHRRGADRAGRDLRLAAVPVGLEFWFSDRARGDAREYRRARAQPTTGSRAGRERDRDDERRPRRLSSRQRSRSTIRASRGVRPPGLSTQPVRSDHLHLRPDGQIRTLALVNPYDRPLEPVITKPTRSPSSSGKESVEINSSDRIGALTGSIMARHLSLCGARVRAAVPRPDRARQRRADDYRALLARSRMNQLRFNARCCSAR
jgi:two-component system nitrogen regulation sensor histidine kinase NtrY